MSYRRLWLRTLPIRALAKILRLCGQRGAREYVGVIFLHPDGREQRLRGTWAEVRAATARLMSAEAGKR